MLSYGNTNLHLHCSINIIFITYFHLYGEFHLGQLGKRPPILTMADLPGYGFAVATVDEMRAWKVMCKKYLSERQILVRFVWMPYIHTYIHTYMHVLMKREYYLFTILPGTKICYPIASDLAIQTLQPKSNQ